MQLKKMQAEMEQEKARCHQLEQRVDELCSELAEMTVRDAIGGSKTLGDEIAAEMETRVRRLDTDRDVLQGELQVSIQVLWHL
jgi:N-acetylglutamate synthase/N-acetylornithine aminotransferase